MQKESKLPLLVEAVNFPNRPARAIVLKFYEERIDVDVVNRNAGNGLFSYSQRYADGLKTRYMLTREVVERVTKSVAKHAQIYDCWRGEALRKTLSDLNPVSIVKKSLEDTRSYIMKRLDIENFVLMIGVR